MADYLSVICSHLPGELVSSRALQRVNHLAAMLPALPEAALECRLGAGEEDVDLLVSFFPSSELAFPPALQNYPEVQRLADFQADCALQGRYPGISHLILEFDLPIAVSNLKVPSIFFCFQKYGVHERSQRQEVALEALIQLLGGINCDELAISLERCFDALPAEAWIEHFGVMLSRQSPRPRLAIKGLSPQELFTYLEDLGWCYFCPEFDRWIEILSELSEEIFLNIDLDREIGPTIGLEPRFSEQPVGEPGWKKLVDFLASQGMCAPEKGAALLQWPGFTPIVNNPEIWPQHLVFLDSMFSAVACGGFMRWINHIKVVYRPYYPPVAKTYLGFAFAYLDRQWLRAEGNTE